jgi:hypothetical protein
MDCAKILPRLELAPLCQVVITTNLVPTAVRKCPNQGTRELNDNVMLAGETSADADSTNDICANADAVEAKDRT